MHNKKLRSIAVRVAYHLQQKLGKLHHQPLRTLVMMVSAFIVAGGPWLSEMGRKLADLPGTLHDKVNRMSRFLAHSEFSVAEVFGILGQRIVEGFARAYPKHSILIAMDWTDLGAYMGLWLSLPYQGRGLPLSCAVLAKSAAENAMTDTEAELLRGFLMLFPAEIRSRIVILADRGFAKRELFDVIEECGASWAIRLPRNRQIRQGDSWVELRDLRLAPGETRLLGEVECVKEAPKKIRLAIRRLRPEDVDPKDDDDTWYVGTNLVELDNVLGWYAKRFSIEEMFRDLKSALNMDRHHLHTEDGVGKMMLIVALAYLVLFEDGNQWRSKVELSRIQKPSAWGALSVFRVAMICFDQCLAEAPEEPAAALLARWTNRSSVRV